MRQRYIYLYPFLLVLAWITAWLGNRELRSAWRWGVTADTLYWIAAKVLIWLAPVCVLILAVEKKGLADFLELRRFRRGVVWGVLAGLVVVTADYLLVAHPGGKHLALPSASAAFLNAVVVAPVTEEVTFRGFFLQRLQLNGISFWMSNVLTSVVFIAMHLVGWFFQGRAGSLVPLMFLSLLFGWLKWTTGSLYAPMAIHILNNFYSSALTHA